MEKGILAVMCAVVLFVTVAIGYAGQRDWRGEIRTRIHEAKGRIERGIETGIPHKARNTEAPRGVHGILDKINRMKKTRPSPKEREIINRDLDRLNRDITKRKAHDYSNVESAVREKRKDFILYQSELLLDWR